MRRVVTRKQLDVISKLQSDDSLIIQVGGGINFIRQSDGTSAGRVDLRSIQNLIRRGILVAIQNALGGRSQCYRLSSESKDLQFMVSITPRKGGAGGTMPTRVALEAFVAENGGKLVWYPCRSLFFLTVGDLTVPIATERDLTPLRGIRHFATMAEWEKFFMVEIEDLKKRQTNRDEK